MWSVVGGEVFTDSCSGLLPALIFGAGKKGSNFSMLIKGRTTTTTEKFHAME